MLRPATSARSRWFRSARRRYRRLPNRRAGLSQLAFADEQSQMPRGLCAQLCTISTPTGERDVSAIFAEDKLQRAPGQTWVDVLRARAAREPQRIACTFVADDGRSETHLNLAE